MALANERRVSRRRNNLRPSAWHPPLHRAHNRGMARRYKTPQASNRRISRKRHNNGTVPPT